MTRLAVLALAVFILPGSSAVYAATGNDIALLFRGAARTLFSAFEIPRTILQNPGGTPFPLNIVTGTVAGSLKTVAGTVMGAADLARGAAPYAKYLVFL